MRKMRRSSNLLRAGPVPPVAKSSALTEEGIVINGVDWEQYEQLVDLFAEDRVFMTYDKGRLELRSQTFPQLTAKLILQWLKVGKSKGNSAMLKAVRAWCEKQG